MLTKEELDQMRPRIDANSEGPPAHLVEKPVAELRQANSSVFDAIPPDRRERFTGEMARTLANRANVQNSTGQKTEKGKAALSKTMAHGLCSPSLIVGGETAADFEALRASVRKTYNPVNDEEAVLTDQLAQALWRFNRARRVETQIFQVTQLDLLTSSNGSNHADVAFDGATTYSRWPFFSDFADKQDDCINRYLTNRERSYQRAHKALQ